MKDKLTPVLWLLQGEEVTLRGREGEMILSDSASHLTCLGHQVVSEVVRVDMAREDAGNCYRSDRVRIAPQQLNRDLQLR